MTSQEQIAAQRRHNAGAVIATVVAFIVGQAFAYSPIEVWSQDELVSVMMPDPENFGVQTR